MPGFDSHRLRCVNLKQVNLCLRFLICIMEAIIVNAPQRVKTCRMSRLVPGTWCSKRVNFVFWYMTNVSLNQFDPLLV